MTVLLESLNNFSKHDHNYVPEKYINIVSNSTSKIWTHRSKNWRWFAFQEMVAKYIQKNYLLTEPYGENVPKKHKISFATSTYNYMSFLYNSDKYGLL